MTNKVLSALKGNICHIQLKLSDFSKVDPEPSKIITDRFMESKKPHYINERLVLLPGNHFDLVKPICPSCGSDRVIKQEYYERNPILGEFGPQKIYLRRYLCKKCGKKFITPLDSVVKPKHRYASVFSDSVDSIVKIGYHSLRKIKQELSIFFNSAPSHQTIDRWMKEVINRNEKSIDNSKLFYSGYYCYDEEYIRINGKKCYRLTLFDSVVNIPVSEEIADYRDYITIHSFLKRSLDEKPLYAITTDHLRMYKGIIRRLNAVHQLCIVHLFKPMTKSVYYLLNRKNISHRDKIKLCLYLTEIKDVFRIYDENIAVKKLERLLDKFDDIPVVLQRWIVKKILPNFDRLTSFMRDGFISRTNNPVENYYRQTDPDQIKKKYKTSQGILSYLYRKMDYWTVKFGGEVNTT